MARGPWLTVPCHKAINAQQNSDCHRGPGPYWPPQGTGPSLSTWVPLPVALSSHTRAWTSSPGILGQGCGQGARGEVGSQCCSRAPGARRTSGKESHTLRSPLFCPTWTVCQHPLPPDPVSHQGQRGRPPPLESPPIAGGHCPHSGPRPALLCRDTKHLRKPGASLTPPSARDTHSTLQDYALHPHEGSPVPTAPGSTTGIPPSPHLRVRAPHSAWQRSSGRGRCILKDTPGRGESSTKVNLRDLKQPAGGKEPWGASKPLACGKASFFKPGSAEAEGSLPAPPGLPAAQARERYGPRGAVTHACRRRLPCIKHPPAWRGGTRPPCLAGRPPFVAGCKTHIRRKRENISKQLLCPLRTCRPGERTVGGRFRLPQGQAGLCKRNEVSQVHIAGGAAVVVAGHRWAGWKARRKLARAPRPVLGHGCWGWKRTLHRPGRRGPVRGGKKTHGRESPGRNAQHDRPPSAVPLPTAAPPGASGPRLLSFPRRSLWDAGPSRSSLGLARAATVVPPRPPLVRRGKGSPERRVPANRRGR